MARHSGKDGLVKLNGGSQVTVAGLTGWDISETIATTPSDAAGDDWTSPLGTQKSWSGSIKMRLDHGAAGQTFRAGDTLAFEGYTEGDASGKTYYSGNILLTSHGLDSPFDGTVEREYSFEGVGALSSAAVV